MGMIRLTKRKMGETYKKMEEMVEHATGHERGELLEALKREVVSLKTQVYQEIRYPDAAPIIFLGYLNRLLVTAAERKEDDMFALLYESVECKDKISYQMPDDLCVLPPGCANAMLEESVLPFYEMWISCAGRVEAGSLIRKDILNVLSEFKGYRKTGKAVKKLKELFQRLDTGACEDCTQLLEMRCEVMTNVLEFLEKDTPKQFLSMNLYEWEGINAGGFPINRMPVIFRCVRPSEIRPDPDQLNLKLIRGNRLDILEKAVKWGYITSVNALPLYEKAAEQRLCGEKTLMFLIGAYRRMIRCQSDSYQKEKE